MRPLSARRASGVGYSISTPVRRARRSRIRIPAAPRGLPCIEDRFICLPYRYGYMGHSEPARPPDEKPLAGRAFPLTSCKGHDDMAGGGLDTSFVGSDGTLQEACFVPKRRQAGQGAWA